MEILNYEEAQPGTSLIATFSLFLGPQWGVTYHKLALRKGKHGPFVAIPCYAKEERGEKKFHPYIELSREKKKEFDVKVMELLKAYIHE